MKQKVMYWLLALACWCSSQAVHAQAPGESAIWVLLVRNRLVLCNADQPTAPNEWRGERVYHAHRMHSQAQSLLSWIPRRNFGRSSVYSIVVEPSAVGSGSIHCKGLFAGISFGLIEEGREVLVQLIAKAKDGDASAMFSNNLNLYNIDLSGTNVTQLTKLDSLFSGCTNLSRVNMSGWNTANVTDMSNMFNNCRYLGTLDISGWNTTNVTNMANMFNNCQYLQTLDISGWNTANVTDMSNMFNNCQYLRTLDISGWNTTNVTNMANMFNNCQSVPTLNVSGWNTANVTDMSNMFNNCQNLQTLDISGWNTAQVTKMDSMFNNCPKVTTLNVSGWNTEQVTNMANMFSDCPKLTALDVSGWNTANVTDMNRMFANCRELTTLNLSPSWNTTQITDLDSLFWDCQKLTAIDVSGWNTAQVTSMKGVFYHCNNMTTLDVSGWNTANVTHMNRMFEGCEKVSTLDVSGWNTANVTDMGSMFANCPNVATLDVSGWNTANVTDMNRMFGNCKNVTTLDVSGWNTANVTDMRSMFADCEKVSALAVENWDVSKVTMINGLFNNCKSLVSLDLSAWRPQKLGYGIASNRDFEYLFDGCTNLRSVDLSNWGEMPHIRAGGLFYTFRNCHNLESIKMPGWKPRRWETMWHAFAGCYSLRELDMSGLEISQVDRYAFGNSDGALLHTFNLQYIDLRNTNIPMQMIVDMQETEAYEPGANGGDDIDSNPRRKLFYAPIGMQDVPEGYHNIVTTSDGTNYTCKHYALLDERVELDSIVTMVRMFHTMPPHLQTSEQMRQFVNEKYPKYVLNIPIPFTAEKVEISQRFGMAPTQVGDAYTWHMPFDAPIPTNVKAYEFVHNTVVGARATFRLTSDARLQAQKPYILVPTSGTIPSLINGPCRIETYTPGSDIVVEGDGWDFVGTFKRRTTAEAAAEGLYALQPENIWRTYEGSTALPSSIRAYLKKKGTSGGAATLSIVFEDGITSINSASNDTANAPIYDLSGRYVGKDKAQLPKGLYIVGGQKIAIP